MLLDENAWIALDAASGALFIVLGAYVAMHRPRTETTLLVAAFTMLLGSAIAVQNVASFYDGDRSWLYRGSVAAGLLGAAALVLLLLRFPSVASRSELVAAAVLGVPVVLDASIGNLLTNGIRPMMVSFAFAAAFVGWRAGLAEAGSRERRVMLLMTAALVLFPAFAAGRQLHAVAAGEAAWQILAPLLLVAVAVAVWTVHMFRWSGRDAAGARAIVWLSLACVLVGLAVRGFFPQYESLGAPGLVRTTGVLVLAYAILRQQFLGADVTARFAISRTSLAAVFIAVFFVASEAAQEFFGATLGSSYVGILAAGALVFAIAPLSKLADRFAEKAVPRAPTGGADEERLRRESTYREAVRYTLRDGVMTTAEEIHLARLATDLGIAADRAVELRHDVASEVR